MHAPSLAQALIGALLLGSAVASDWASRAEVPYSDAFPKRVLVQHLHVLGPDGGVQVALCIASLAQIAVLAELSEADNPRNCEHLLLLDHTYPALSGARSQRTLFRPQILPASLTVQDLDFDKLCRLRPALRADGRLRGAMGVKEDKSSNAWLAVGS